MLSWKYLLVVIAVCMPFAAISTNLAAAQDKTEIEADTETDAELKLDGVTAVGIPPIYGDAWAAFQAGDYATAEVEFEDIFSRSFRAQGRFQNALNLSSAAAANNAGVGDALNTPIGGSNGAQEQATGAVSDNASSAVVRPQGNGGRTVTRRADLGFPLYMAGLSEIQLGRYEEARDSFYRALNFNPQIHDARFRIGLLEVFDGNNRKANRQLRKLKAALRRCRNRCEEQAELEASISFLARAIAGPAEE